MPSVSFGHLSQYDYVETTLDRFGLENCKPVATPMDEKQVSILWLGSNATKAEAKEFQTMIDTSIWLPRDRDLEGFAGLVSTIFPYKEKTR